MRIPSEKKKKGNLTSFLSASKTARALNKLLFERLLRYDSKEPFFGLPLCRLAAKFSFLSMRT